MLRIFFLFLLPFSSPAAQPDPRPVLVIVGMASEAKIAAGAGAQVVVSAGSPALLRARLAHLSRADVRAVVSFGISGGLNPALHAGDVLTNGAALDGAATMPADQALARFITLGARRAGRAPLAGIELGQDTVSAVDPASRRRLRLATKADAVDTETQVAADFAAREGLPFAFVRAVADTASFTMPPASLIALKPDGTPDGAAVFDSLIHDPWQLPALIEVAIDSGKALGTLRAIRQKLDWTRLP